MRKTHGGEPVSLCVVELVSVVGARADDSQPPDQRYDWGKRFDSLIDRFVHDDSFGPKTIFIS